MLLDRSFHPRVLWRFSLIMNTYAQKKKKKGKN
jgi:hypothetical protein